jgi:hypothetical protein
MARKSRVKVAADAGERGVCVARVRTRGRRRSTAAPCDARPRKCQSASQREILRDAMLSASACGMWLTLRELSQQTQFGEASISAQLRHLRKPRNGGFVIEKRARECERGARTATEPRFEYRLGGSAVIDTIASWRTIEILTDAIQTARKLDAQRGEGTGA